jgi:hypothetical protein
MQARLETRRFPSAAVALVFAVLAVFMLSAGGGYAIKGLSTPAVHRAPVTQLRTVEWGSLSDLTRVLPHKTAQGGPTSDLTRALPTKRIGSDCANPAARNTIGVNTVC